jgi:hypothetical protein
MSPEYKVGDEVWVFDVNTCKPTRDVIGRVRCETSASYPMYQLQENPNGWWYESEMARSKNGILSIMHREAHRLENDLQYLKKEIDILNEER